MSSIKVIPPLFDSEAEELQIGTESGRTFRFKHELDGSTSPGERLACNFELQWWCTKITGAKRNYSRNPESAQQNNSAAGSGGAPPPPPVGTPRASFSSSPVVEPIMKKTPLAAESVVSKTLPPAAGNSTAVEKMLPSDSVTATGPLARPPPLLSDHGDVSSADAALRSPRTPMTPKAF